MGFPAATMERSSGWSPRPSSSARCRPWPSSGRGRPALTTSTRVGGQARPGDERPAGAGRRPGARPRAPLERPRARREWPRRTALRRRHPYRQPWRRDLPRHRGAAGGATRRGGGHASTRRLFARYAIETHLVSYHARSGPGREAELLAHLRSGRDLALVTDAGTPLISDPGGELVSAWAAEGGRVVPSPARPRCWRRSWQAEWPLPTGRSRVPAAHRPRAAGAAGQDRGRRTRLRHLRGSVACPATLADLAAAAGAERRAAVCRELTKLMRR